MKTIKLRVLAIALLIVVCQPVKQARADLFGGDVAVLVQILANAFQQLAQLQKILGAGRDTIALMEDINRGVNDSLNVLRTISPYTDPGIYKDWTRVQDALRALTQVYGSVVTSREATIQRDTDQNVAEAVTLNNQIYKYADQVDVIGEQIKQYSHAVSPGGAAKLTAQSLGIMLNVMNQSLRTQATGLKLQAQAMAVDNHKEKESTRYELESTRSLGDAMKAQDTSFKLPRL